MERSAGKRLILAPRERAAESRRRRGTDHA